MSDSVDSDAEIVLPRQRAFLVQLSRTANPGGGRIAGHAVHIDSGSAAPFASVDELLARFATPQPFVAGQSGFARMPATEDDWASTSAAGHAAVRQDESGGEGPPRALGDLPSTRSWATDLGSHRRNR